MYRPLLWGALCLTLAVLGGAGCSESQDPQPVLPTPVEITEPPFTGTLTVNGAVTTNFNVNGVGTVSAILAGLDPNPDNLLSIGIDLGVWNGTSCQVTLVNPNAGLGSGTLGQTNATGTLCVHVYDAGRLTESVNFNITIKHY